MGAAKLLGEIFTCKLSFGDHVDFVLTVCSQRVYLLKLLRSLGLPIPQLHTVFVALILSRITCTLTAWGGQLIRQLRNAWMLVLNWLKSLVFVMKIIPKPNNLRRQMLGFLGLFKDQNIVFTICYLILLTAVLWS